VSHGIVWEVGFFFGLFVWVSCRGGNDANPARKVAKKATGRRREGDPEEAGKLPPSWEGKGTLSVTFRNYPISNLGVLERRGGRVG